MSTGEATVDEATLPERLADRIPRSLLVTAGPVVLLELALFVGPLCIMLLISTIEMRDFQLVYDVSLSNFFDGLDKYQNRIAIWNTVVVSVLTVLTTLAIAYPIAYYIARHGGRRKNQLAMLIIIPFWTNYVVRVYGWRLMLSENGFINNALMGVGVTSEPVGWLLNTRFAIGLGLVYLWLPFMILPLYSSIEKIDSSVIEAAYDLGASRLDVFRRVIVPLSIPGLVAGVIFTFIFSMGAFIVPSLLGGGVQFIGTRIHYEFGFGADWPAGAALGSVLMFTVIAVLGLILRYADMEAMFS